MSSVAVELERVPETLLWTLHHRADEARRPDTVLRDPMAVELVERIDFPFRERFGAGEALSQWQALRARSFDTAVRQFLSAHPAGTVVALGEGLETQFWRVDNGQVRWLTVDFPEVIALRLRLLPQNARRQEVGSSVLEPGWMDEVDDSSGVLFTAQGLLMYLGPDEAHGLIARCAERFRRGAIVFDVIPRWLAERSRRGQLKSKTGYEPPPWSWGFDRDEERRLRQLPGVAQLRTLPPPRGRGVALGWLIPLAGKTQVRRWLPSVLLARFA